VPTRGYLSVSSFSPTACKICLTVGEKTFGWLLVGSSELSCRARDQSIMDARAEVGGDEPPLPSMDPRDPRDRFDVLEDS